MIFDKKGLMKNNAFHLALILVIAIAIVFVGNFVIADTYQFWGQTDTITVNHSIHATSNNTINEDALYNFSILINSTTQRMGVSFNITRINVTLPAEIIFQNYSNLTGGNISGLQVKFINTSDGKGLSWSNTTVGEQEYIIAGGNASFNNSLIYFNFTVYTPGKYNISVQIFYNGTAPLLTFNKTNISIWVNDTTRPFNVNVTTEGKINGSRNANNLSGSVEINVSAFDNGNHTYGARGYDVTGVNITVYNNTAGVNASYTMTNVTGQYWNFTLSSTKFPDGAYNISLFVNDTNGNVNSTNISVRIDNTAPTGSATCSPSGVNLGDTVTCSCSVTDATSGENSSVTSITASPSTTSTGTFTQTCSFADLAGNTGTTTAQYTVEQGGSGAGTGAATSGADTGVTTLPAHVFSKITPGAAEVKTYTDPDLGLKEIQIEVKSEAQSVKVSVTKYDSKPAEVSVEKTGKTYQYMQIKVDNIADKLDKATITSKIKKSWVSSNGLEKEDVAVFKYDESASKWNELTTAYDSEDDTYYYYTSEVSSFSYFAVGEKVLVTETGEEVGVSEQETGEETTEAGNLTWLWIVIAVIVLAIIIGGIAWKKKGSQ